MPENSVDDLDEWEKAEARSRLPRVISEASDEEWRVVLAEVEEFLGSKKCSSSDIAEAIGILKGLRGPSRRPTA